MQFEYRNGISTCGLSRTGLGSGQRESVANIPRASRSSPLHTLRESLHSNCGLSSQSGHRCGKVFSVPASERLPQHSSSI